MRTCSVDGCDRGHIARGYCSVHYKRYKKHGDPGEATLRRDKGRVCTVDGCEKPHQATGLCLFHKRRADKGIPLDAPLRSERRRVGRDGYIYAGRIAEHRLIMEQALGRPLWPDENVHHINGVKHDNRLENLELWSTSQPAGQRIEDKVAWAEQILARYRDYQAPGVTPGDSHTVNPVTSVTS